MNKIIKSETRIWCAELCFWPSLEKEEDTRSFILFYTTACYQIATNLNSPFFNSLSPVSLWLNSRRSCFCLHHRQIIVREMNRLGMAVDLSKASVKTMRDVLTITEAPIIFSHSSAFGLCNSSRNVHDEILKLVTKNGGLVMVNFYNKFLSCNENATVHDAVGMYI